ncbi:MAG: hypothetical protein ABS46_09205 [Cytophagaceae bacterium SCN 52-12]|nr:MAG: hypothetical protein ABS46_09205 [Cytophagaceae bacterium SCN 52-12]
MQEDLPITRVAIRYGLIFGLISSIYGILLYVFQLETNKFLPQLNWILFIFAIVVAIKEYRKQNQGFVSYGQGLGIGSLTATIMGLIGGMLNTFYLQVIDNTPLQRIADMTREDLERRGLDDQAIENALEMSQKFQSPGMFFVFSVLGSAFVGFILSLIIAAILQKKRPTFE